MINTLSILIPTYNHVCTELVESLQAQVSSLPNLEYEILVADDGSTDEYTIEENRIINQLDNCRYIERETNVGRAAIRNFLAQQAKHPWLLFIDSNMYVILSEYLSYYLNQIKENNADFEDSIHIKYGVIYGGYQIKRDDETKERLKNNLRYIFESRCTQNGDYRERQANPYRDFHTSNFIVQRNIILKYPLDERFYHYGYEDVLWGKTLKDNHILIKHIDNPLEYDHFIGNMSFVSKTEESLRTLYQFREELEGYSKIIDYAQRLKRWHLSHLCQKLFPLFSLPIKARLTGNKPSILWFNIYKLLYYIHLEA